jgi:hypothetical protein
MVVEEKESRDNKVIYHLNIDEETNDILMHLSSLKNIKINRVIKGTTLVSAFYIFSLAFYSYLFHISFAWIFLLLSIGFAALGLSVEKLQKVFMRVIINKEKQKMNSERKYVFSKEGVDIAIEMGVTHNYWNSFVSKGEIENHIYLVRKDNKVILINKAVISESELIMLRSFIQDIETEQLETKNKMSFKMKTLVVATVVTIIVSLIYTGIKIGYPLSNGEIFRLWFIRTVPIIQLFILQCLNIIWTCVLSRIIKKNKKKSLLKRILLWVVGIIVVLAMALGIFVTMLNDESEYYNSNGTVIVKTPVWLDKPSFGLYRVENILVLQFLRNADGIEDIDASITQQEYLDKKYGDLEKESEQQDENKNESSLNDMTTESQQDLEKTKKIDEGYLKIYQTYIKDTDAEYRKDYNAKGYSYIVTYEDETQIRYLMYDRDNQEGTKAQYVYYKSIKSTDGSWSMMDAEILDMYQYDYESKEVKDLQQTSW